MVEDLWNRALASPSDRLQVRERAERLLMQVNSKNPVVNWGLTELYHLTSRAPATTDDLAASHAPLASRNRAIRGRPCLVDAHLLSADGR